MSELRDLMRAAIEAQGRHDPDEVAAAADSAVPDDEDAWRQETGRLPAVEDSVGEPAGMTNAGTAVPGDDPHSGALASGPSPTEQLDMLVEEPRGAYDDATTRGYVATDHAPAAHTAAAQTAGREGAKGIVSPDSDRHRMLRLYGTGVRLTLIDAGVYAHTHLAVGKTSVTGWDTGRRRASELAEFGLLDQQVDQADGHAYYVISALGRDVLAIVDSGKRWTA